MKKILIFCLIISLVYSCNSNDDSSNSSSTDVFLKEVNSEWSSDSNSDLHIEKYYYYQDGRPEFYEYFRPNTDIQPWAEHFFTHDSENLIQSVFLSITGESGIINFDYENGDLKYIEWGIPQPNQRYEIILEDSSIIMKYMTGFGGNWNSPSRIETYNFNNENYDLLINSNISGSISNDNPPTFITSYEYDENSNLISVIQQSYDGNTQTYNDYITTNFDYDIKENPYKQEYLSHPVIRHNLISLPSSILQNDKISSNNITSKTINNYLYDTTLTMDFVYEYNDLNYPVSSIETTTFANGETSITTKTYTYY